MKKKKIYLLVIGLLLILVSGCSKKGIDSDKMASLFVDKFIYDKSTTDFEENFVDGDLLGKQLTLMTNTFEDTFSAVFDPITDKLSTEEKERIATDLMDKMRKESSYTYTIKEESKDKVKVTYKIQGLDYADLVEQTLEGLFLKLNEDTSDDETIQKEVLSSFEEALVNAKAVKNDMEVTLEFEKVKSNWQISDNQDKALEQMLMTFVTGQKDKKVYEKEMNEVVQRAVKNATAE